MCSSECAFYLVLSQPLFPSSRSALAAAEQADLLDIQTATAEQLKALRGIGEASSEEIIRRTLFCCLFHWLDANGDYSRTGWLLQFFFRERQGRGANGSEVDQILRKEHIESPVQGHEDFLFKARQF